MTTCYGINGIGFPTFGLGNYGLGGYNGYSSYGMYPGMNLGFNGMYGMYDPSYWAKTMQNIEATQLAHATDMHKLTTDAAVQKHRRSNEAVIEKILTNGGESAQVDNLCIKVRSGDMEGACSEFDNLKKVIQSKYADQLKERGVECDIEIETQEIIKSLYRNKTNGKDLESEMKQYGESAAENGFYRGFKHNHSKMYVDEAINHCFGRRIENKGSKDMEVKLCEGVGRTASVLQKGVYGAAIGTGAFTLGSLFAKGGASLFNSASKVPFMTKGWFKAAGKVGLVAGFVGMIADGIWQATRD